MVSFPLYKLVFSPLFKVIFPDICVIGLFSCHDMVSFPLYRLLFSPLFSIGDFPRYTVYVIELFSCHDMDTFPVYKLLFSPLFKVIFPDICVIGLFFCHDMFPFLLYRLLFSPLFSLGDFPWYMCNRTVLLSWYGGCLGQKLPILYKSPRQIPQQINNKTQLSPLEWWV